MPHRHRARILTSTALAFTVTGTLVAACKGGGKDNAVGRPYANEGDTGAAAPATQQTLSPNPSMGDSTVGMSRGTGVGNAAGDTAGAFGKAAGAHGAIPGKPTSGPPGSGMPNTANGAPQSPVPARPKTTRAPQP